MTLCKNSEVQVSVSVINSMVVSFVLVTLVRGLGLFTINTTASKNIPFCIFFFLNTLAKYILTLSSFYIVIKVSRNGTNRHRV